MLSATRHLYLSLGLGMLLISCSAVEPAKINELYREVLEQRRGHYRIKPGDTLALRFYYVPTKGDLNVDQQFLVLPDGRTDPLFMDNLVVAGMTVEEFKAKAEESYKQELTEPEISLLVTPAKEYVVVEGEVERPGLVDYFPQMTLSQLLSRSGGYKITACADSVTLKRPYLDQAHPDIFIVDIKDESEEIFLLPEDQVLVERNVWIYVRDYLREYVWGMLPPLFSTLFGAGGGVF